jgi:membrane protein implicated in regulation of membrane protease activity
MFKSALFYAQSFSFFAGIFLCAGVSDFIRHSGSFMWISYLILSGVFLLASRRYADKLRRKLPQVLEIRHSD